MIKNINEILKYIPCIIIIISLTANKANAETWQEICKLNAEVSAAIMKGRQNGVEMSKMIELIADSDNKDGAEAIVIMAYDTPRYRTDEMITRSIEDFRNEIYLACAKAHRQKNKN